MNKNVNILIAEDERDLNDAYSMILKSAGYSVRAASDGKQALDYIKREGDPDIILLDLRMPVMAGIEFLKKYNAPSHPDTTIILFSNYEVQREVDEAFDLGVHRYILKSLVSPKELIRIIQLTSKHTN